jgi:hypothetical protein
MLLSRDEYQRQIGIFLEQTAAAPDAAGSMEGSIKKEEESVSNSDLAIADKAEHAASAPTLESAPVTDSILPISVEVVSYSAKEQSLREVFLDVFKGRQWFSGKAKEEELSAVKNFFKRMVFMQTTGQSGIVESALLVRMLCALCKHYGLSMV